MTLEKDSTAADIPAYEKICMYYISTLLGIHKVSFFIRGVYPLAQGSGRAADILAYAHRHASRNSSTGVWSLKQVAVVCAYIKD